MKTILILGSSGLLGSELNSGKYLKEYNIISQSLKSKTDLKINLNFFSQTTKMLEKIKPDIIINLVSLTNVDDCEKFPDKAFRSNIKTIQNLVDGIKINCPNCFLIHISTDQVYDGTDINSEKDINLANYYAYSKYIGELIASKVKCTILRTSFFGKSRNPRRVSFTDWLYKELVQSNNINLFDDILFNPLSLNNLCKMIELVVEKKIQGIFNLGSNEGMSKADFGYNFAKLIKLSTLRIKRIKSSNAKFLIAYRPKNMIMNLTKFEHEFKIKLPLLIDEIKLTSKEYL